MRATKKSTESVDPQSLLLLRAGRMGKIRHALGVALAVLWALPAWAAGLADLPSGWKSISLLRDRLQVDVPAGTELAPPPYGFMEAPESPEVEIVASVEAGSARLSMHVSEMFRTAPADFSSRATAFLEDVARMNGFGPLAPPRLRRVNGLDLLETEPLGKATARGANLFRFCLVRRSDDSLQLIAFILNDAGMADLPAARSVVERIVASLRTGSRPLTFGALIDVGPRLTLNVPAGYAAYFQQGIDFGVHWVHPVVALGQRAGSLRIYVGHHPPPREAPATARSATTTFLGVPATWRTWEAGGGEKPRVWFQEAYVTVPRHGDVVFRIFTIAISEGERAVFDKIVATATHR